VAELAIAGGELALVADRGVAAGAAVLTGWAELAELAGPGACEPPHALKSRAAAKTGGNTIREVHDMQVAFAERASV
jgi:hypothetical protein